MGRAFQGVGEEGAIQAGLEKLVTDLLQRSWSKAGGGLARIDRLLVDMGYKSGVVAAVKHKAGGSAMMLSKGVGLRAGSKPISMYQRRPGWTLGADGRRAERGVYERGIRARRRSLGLLWRGRLLHLPRNRAPLGRALDRHVR